MDQEILEEYEKVKDKISKEEFEEKIAVLKKDYEDTSFINDIDIARMVVGEFVDENVESISNNEEHIMNKINKLEEGAQNLTIIGKVMAISNIKQFTSRKGKEGKLCNLKLADDTGEVRVVFWTENIKLLKDLKEGDVIEIINVAAKDGYRGLEIHLQPRSTLKLLNALDYPTFPDYEEPITLIEDIQPDETVNIIGRIIRIPPIRKYNSNGKKGEVTSIELQDNSGKISYTLWNKDVKLIENLGLKENDAIKILGAHSRERNGEISLSHWDGKIVKDNDLNVPKFEEVILKIGEAHQEKDVTILGIITKIQDTITFQRKDGNDGYVKSIEVADDTGSIRVTLWNDDTNIEFNKGDIVKIIGGNIEYDDYATNGYRVNTNWNTRFIINPEGNEELVNNLKELQSNLGPLPIISVQDIEEDGEEIDIVGRIVSLNDSREFHRDDGSNGIVRSADFADQTGIVRVSFWDDKATDSNLQLSKPFQLENARTKLGMYAVELNIGKTARVILLDENDAADLPSFSELEEMLYEMKKIDELDEDDRNIRVVARILDMQDIREFNREDGTPGMVRTIDLADDTGSIKASLWDSKTNLQEFDVGSAVKIENPRLAFRDDRIELNIGNNSNIVSPSEEELNSLPTFDELKDIIYQSKTIDSLNDDDINVKVSGTLNDPFGEKLVLLRCPNCNNPIEMIDDEYVCDYCGEEIEEPKYLLMLPAKLVDDTNSIQITFFGKLVEELLGMKESDIVTTLENGDSSVLENKVENLNGISIEVLADVNFDEYNESIRLNPKKILSKSL
jgi:replication factor A1